MKKTRISWLAVLLIVAQTALAVDAGIISIGKDVGGHFGNEQKSSLAGIAVLDHGIAAAGNVAGGYFLDLDSTSSAWVGYGGLGIYATGSEAGGYFEGGDSSGYAYVGYGDWGVWGVGDTGGGYFRDSGDPDNPDDKGTFALVGSGSHKILGTGSVNFIQNHPTEPSQVIVYAAPEGDEVATYTRGTAKLVNGEARITLGETFKWVTNPDIGLTAHLTPQGAGTVLYVASKTTEELVVRSMEGFPDDVTFDYIVHGLRIGFEEVAIVQKKTEEASIPSMQDHRALYKDYPELLQYNALERFGTMRVDIGMKSMPDMKAAEELKSAINVFDPAVHTPPLFGERLPEPKSPVQFGLKSLPDSSKLQ